MTATKPPALRWTLRWLGQNGHGLPPLDAHAFELLRARLAARRRSLLALAVASVVAVAAVVRQGAIAIATLDGNGRTPWTATVGWLLVTPVVALLVGGGVQTLVEARAESRISTSLSRRLTRAEAVRLTEVAGRRVVLSVTVALLAAAALTALTWLSAPGWPAVTVTATSLLAVLGAAGRMWRALARPALAYDALTLTLDERLRRADVVQGAQLLVISLVMIQLVRPFVLSPSTPDAVALTWFAVVPAIMVVQFVLTLPPRWPGPAAGPVPAHPSPAASR